MNSNILKIREDVNLEDLINYGFEKHKNGKFYIKTVYSKSTSLKLIESITYHIDIETRFIEIITSNIDFIIDDTLWILIKDDIIESLNIEIDVTKENIIEGDE